eukprot:TRINITY_DN29375_c0_g1_i1.p2 TRINITY_DN29375_c0_g1~~TRINITY_DN29375_c0_g1_i1.p2  ORF type:complete len:210 (+),score=36.90 TRINITY_DN29375_c0_g1_i1:172-801(+)
MAKFAEVGKGSKLQALDKANIAVLTSKLVEPVLFPKVKNWDWPYGTRGSWLGPEDVLRYMGTAKMYASQIQKTKDEENVHMIGDGIVARPPCGGPKGCELLDDTRVDPEPEEDAVAADPWGLGLLALGLPAARRAVASRITRLRRRRGRDDERRSGANGESAPPPPAAFRPRALQSRTAEAAGASRRYAALAFLETSKSSRDREAEAAI